MHTVLIWHPSRLPPNAVLEKELSKHSSAHVYAVKWKSSRSYLLLAFIIFDLHLTDCVCAFNFQSGDKESRRAAISPGRATCGIFLWIINSRGPLSVSSVIIHYHTRPEKLKVIVIMRASAMHPQWDDESRRGIILSPECAFPRARLHEVHTLVSDTLKMIS